MKKLLSFLPALLLTTTLVQVSDQTQEIQEKKSLVTRKFNVSKDEQPIEQQNLTSSKIVRGHHQKIEESGTSHEESQQQKKNHKEKKPFQTRARANSTG